MRRIVVLLSLGILIFLAGCIQGPETPGLYKNDVITIEHYTVSTLSPYSDSETTIEFDLQSNADEKIPYVEVSFFDIPGFSLTSLDCGTGTPPPEKNKCIFSDGLDSLDSRRIVLQLKAPTVNLPTAYTVSFSVNYNYNGIREALIPIIDGVTKKQPTSKFQQSQPSYGPVLLDIQPSLERQTKVGKAVVKEYWGIADKIFETRFKFSQIGKVEGVVKEVVIPKGQVTMIERTNLNLGGFCDFSPDGSSQKNVRIPYDVLICNFNPVSINDQPEYPAIIKVTYWYTYEFIRTETFVIQPRVGFK